MILVADMVQSLCPNVVADSAVARRTADGYQGWDGTHPILSDGVGEGILYTTKHGALLAAMRLIKELIP